MGAAFNREGAITHSAKSFGPRLPMPGRFGRVRLLCLQKVSDADHAMAVLAAPDLQCSGIAGNRLPRESRPILGVDSGGRGRAPRASQRLQLGAGALASWLGFHEDAHVGDVASADNFVKEAEPIGLFRGQFVLPLLEGLTK